MEKLITPQQCVELDIKYGQNLILYLTLSQEDKRNDIINHGLWLFANYISIYYFGEDKSKILTDIRRKFHDNKEILLEDIINGIYNRFYKKFSDYLLNYYKSIEHFCEAPVWICYTKPKVCKNRWAIFSEDSNFNCIGNLREKYHEDYNVGYLSHDVDTLDYPIEDNKIYILCRVNGIRAYNIIDKEYHILFWQKTAKDYIYIKHMDGKWNVFCKDCEKVLFTCMKLSEIAEWIKQEDNKYRNIFLDFLIDKKNRKILE